MLDLGACFAIDYSVKIENYSIDYLVRTQTDFDTVVLLLFICLFVGWLFARLHGAPRFKFDMQLHLNLRQHNVFKPKLGVSGKLFLFGFSLIFFAKQT